jgi:hypothetical protein
VEVAAAEVAVAADRASPAQPGAAEAGVVARARLAPPRVEVVGAAAEGAGF